MVLMASRLSKRQFSYAVLATGLAALVLGFLTAALGASRNEALLVCAGVVAVAVVLLLRVKPLE
jgi:hypothetical protein